jgi:pSer/pThr/pTyr-binding forkhead associated (FHA) protein
MQSLGKLVPIVGGDPIPLMKRGLVIGRRDPCDIVLPFSNVSARHCQLTAHDDHWRVADLGSANGTRVNGVRIHEWCRLNPGDKLAVSGHEYEIQYSLDDL